MAYSPGDLRREIIKVIEIQLAANQPVKWMWLVNDVLKRHPLPMLPDFDFNNICRRGYVGECVREVLRDLKLDASNPASVASGGQLPLPGYKHLQQGYPVERNKQIVIVPIDLMTDAERWGRAQQYRAMSKGCLKHAEELERYQPTDRIAS